MTATAHKQTAGHVSFVCDAGDHHLCDHADCECPCHQKPQPEAPKPETPAKPAPPAAQYAWLVPDQLAAEIVRAGAGCLFEIVDRDSRGKMRVTTYALRVVRDRGRFAGWSVQKLGCDGEMLEEYHLDVSFGPEVRHAECTCGAYCFRSRERGPCRHLLAVWTLLGRIGISPRTGE
jgi:hypothetical protein